MAENREIEHACRVQYIKPQVTLKGKPTLSLDLVTRLDGKFPLRFVLA